MFPDNTSDHWPLHVPSAKDCITKSDHIGMTNPRLYRSINPRQLFIVLVPTCIPDAVGISTLCGRAFHQSGMYFVAGSIPANVYTCSCDVNASTTIFLRLKKNIRASQLTGEQSKLKNRRQTQRAQLLPCSEKGHTTSSRILATLRQSATS